MEDSIQCQATDSAGATTELLANSGLTGAEAALKRAAAKAIKRARDAGLEPVVQGEIGNLD